MQDGADSLAVDVLEEVELHPTGSPAAEVLVHSDALGELVLDLGYGYTDFVREISRLRRC